MLLEARPQCNASQVQPDHMSSIVLMVERRRRTMFDMCKVVDQAHGPCNMRDLLVAYASLCSYMLGRTNYGRRERPYYVALLAEAKRSLD